MDATENVRRQMVQEINSEEAERQQLEAKYGQVWDTSQMVNDYEAIGFLAPFVMVRRRSDGVKGSLKFQHSPRYYFSFSPS